PGCKNDMSAHVLGTRGRVLLSEKDGGLRLKGQKEWVCGGANNNLSQQKHDDLFASIRSGKPINNGEYMAKSTLLAIMGRMAAYTGQGITWEMAMNNPGD